MSVHRLCRMNDFLMCMEFFGNRNSKYVCPATFKCSAAYVLELAHPVDVKLVVACEGKFRRLF